MEEQLRIIRNKGFLGDKGMEFSALTVRDIKWGKSMTSVHLYQAEKKDVENIYDLLVEFKEIDLEGLNFPDIDKPKLSL